MPFRDESAAELANACLKLEVLPDFGARVSSITDLRTGRQWLAAGKAEGSPLDSAAYEGSEARGWDECLPTVDRCRCAYWPDTLRDHGAFWARPWQTSVRGSGIEAVCRRDGFQFRRLLSLCGAEIEARYQVKNLGSGPLPYLWSQHCLIQVRDGDRIGITGIRKMRLSHGSAGGIPVRQQLFDWPGLTEPKIDLSAVGSLSAGFAAKLYGICRGHVCAAIGDKNGEMRIRWDGGEIPAAGIWINYGGWPPGKPLRHIAVEPASAPVDSLSEACSNGHARWLAPGESHRWTTRMSFTAPA